MWRLLVERKRRGKQCGILEERKGKNREKGKDL